MYLRIVRLLIEVNIESVKIILLMLFRLVISVVMDLCIFILSIYNILSMTIFPFHSNKKKNEMVSQLTKAKYMLKLFLKK